MAYFVTGCGTITALQFAVFTDAVMVVGTPQPATAANVTEILTHGNVTGVLMPPSLIEDLCRDPKGLDAL